MVVRFGEVDGGLICVGTIFYFRIHSQDVLEQLDKSQNRSRQCCFMRDWVH